MIATRKQSAPQIAQLLYTPGEDLWALFVSGHVSDAKFDAAVQRAIKRYPYIASDLVPHVYHQSAAGVLVLNEGEPPRRHLHMRIAKRDDGDMGDVHRLCGPKAKTGFPVTAIMFP